jgi:hypothetical protein
MAENGPQWDLERNFPAESTCRQLYRWRQGFIFPAVVQIRQALATISMLTQKLP